MGNKTIAKNHGHSRTTIIGYRKAHNEAKSSSDPDSALAAGPGRYGTVLYNYDGQYLRKGPGEYSKPLLNVSGTFPVAMLLLIAVL